MTARPSLAALHARGLVPAPLAVAPLLTAAETRHEDALRRSSGEVRAEQPDACAHASPDVEAVRLELARVQRLLDEERRESRATETTLSEEIIALRLEVAALREASR